MESNPPPDYTRPPPDPPLTREEQALVGQLTEQEIQEIDEALLSNACERWRKVSAVVGFTMSSLPNRRRGIPDVFYAQRIQQLVRAGRLEADGNLAYMNFSEVRLPARTR
jgi:Protein of unknown function